MADLDWISGAVLALSMLMGAWRGLVFEILSLANWLLAFVLAHWLAPVMSVYLPMHGSGEVLRFAAGFVMAFVLSLMAGSLAIFLIKKVVYISGMGPIDRALGCVFGALRGVVVLLALALVLRLTPLHDTAMWQEARSPAIAQSLMTALKPWLPQTFGKFLP